MASVCIASLALVVACTTDASPAPAAGPDGTVDPVLVSGRDVYESNCARCHGSAGGGGTGPTLAGRVAERYPDPADQADLIRRGPGAMPSFAERLSDDEVDAVVRYTREVL